MTTLGQQTQSSVVGWAVEVCCPRISPEHSAGMATTDHGAQLLVLFRFLKRCHTFLIFLIVIVAASEVRCC